MIRPPFEEVPWDEMEGYIHGIAREEIASLAGLMLRRLQDEGPTRVAEHNVQIGMQAKMWGEVLRDFSATDVEPGP